MSACTAGTSCSVVLRKFCRCWLGDETVLHRRARSTSLEKGFRAMETRTMQHLDPHSQALFLRSTKCARRRCALFHPRATDRASSLHESFAHAPCAVHVNQRTCFHTAVRATWMSSHTSGDKKTWRSALMSAAKLSCVCGMLTIQRHRDTMRQLWRRRTRKEHQACALWERQRFEKCPLLWQPHDNGDILRSPPTQNVQPCTYLHHASFNMLDQQDEMATVLAVCR